MATNIPPHNLTETIDGIIEYIDNPDVTIEDLMKIIKAPDFPTGGIIVGKSGVRDAYTTGKGRIVVRAVTDIETYGNNRQRIVVTELPIRSTKRDLLRKLPSLSKTKELRNFRFKG